MDRQDTKTGRRAVFTTVLAMPRTWLRLAALAVTILPPHDVYLGGLALAVALMYD